jgi:ribosome biogenesis protein Tsr3
MAAGESFWSVVREPFMERELSRADVRAILQRGLTESHGSYKRLLRKIGVEQADYLKFMDFLRHHRLKPEGYARTPG